MSAPEKHRDLSQLSALLATHTSSPKKKVDAPVLATAKEKKRRQPPANDNKPVREVLAWPAFQRLAYRGDKGRLFALLRWRDMVFPREVVIADDTTKYEPEATIEVRPSEAELLGAVGWKVIDRERWDFTGEMVNTYEPAETPRPEYRTNKNGDLETHVGDLMFRGGELKQWASTRKGATLRPIERPRGIKGRSDATRTDSAIWKYLKLKGAVSPLTAQPYSKPISPEPALHHCYDPLPREEPSVTDKLGRYGVREARQLLADLGVDGSVSFEDLPFPATRYPDGLIGGVQWIGGVKQPKPTASESAGREPEFVRQIETTDYVEHLRSRLGKHAKVLDLAITDTSARDIGISMGLAPSYAEKHGAALIEAAIDALIEIDETAWGNFEKAELTEGKIAA